MGDRPCVSRRVVGDDSRANTTETRRCAGRDCHCWFIIKLQCHQTLENMDVEACRGQGVRERGDRREIGEGN